MLSIYCLVASIDLQLKDSFRADQGEEKSSLQARVSPFRGLHEEVVVSLMEQVEENLGGDEEEAEKYKARKNALFASIELLLDSLQLLQLVLALKV